MKRKSIAKQLKELTKHWQSHWTFKVNKPLSEQVIEGYKREARKGDK